MADITITKINEVHMKVVCAEKFMEMDLSDRFRFKVKNAEFDPRMRYDKWDGFKKMYDRRNKRMYIGLLLELIAFCEKQDFSYYIDPNLLPDESNQLADEDIQELIDFINPHNEKGEPIRPYDWQFDCIKYALNMGRSLCLASTSAGKSLVLYILARIYQLLPEFNDKKIVIIVPTTLLVEQLFADFKDYSNFKDSTWLSQTYTQKIDAKNGTYIHKQIVISTWQSFCKQPKWIYEQIGAVFVDEVHTAAAEVLTNIMESCDLTSVRVGLTGTLNKFECDLMQLTGMFGEPKRFITARELIDSGMASDIEVRVSVVKYPENQCRELHSTLNKIKRSKSRNKGALAYNAELEFLYTNPYRNRMLLQMIEAMEGNTLIMFDRVEAFGEPLYLAYKEMYPDTTFLISGEVDSKTREQIRVSMEKYDNAKIFCTYQTVQAGMSIKKLHNAFFVSSSKSFIRVVQSIGRLMRLHETKTKGYIIDIVDNLTYKNTENSVMKHAAERIGFYTEEKHNIHFDEYDVTDF